jgi:hypothetical protein
MFINNEFMLFDMLTIKSKTDPEKRYFFESLGFVKPEHLTKGLFCGVPSQLENTLDTTNLDPNQQTHDNFEKIIKDCADTYLVTIYTELGRAALITYLDSQGVKKNGNPIRIHTLKVLSK